MTQKWTAQQQKFISAVSEGASTYLEAKAGTGKTTAAVAAIVDLHRRYPSCSVLMTSFNVRIKAEIESRLLKALAVDELPTSLSVRTMNSVGLGVLMANKFCGGDFPDIATGKPHRVVEAALDNRAVAKAIDGMLKPNHKSMASPSLALVEMFNAARLDGILPETISEKRVSSFLLPAVENKLGLPAPFESSDRLAKIIGSLLSYGIDLGRSGLIDFTDQIYLTKFCRHAGRRWDTVLCDEFQDMSDTMFDIALAASKKQLVVAGDRHQLIYEGVTGASLHKLKAWVEETKPTRVQFTKTFRCPPVVCARQLKVNGGLLGSFERHKPQGDGELLVAAFAPSSINKYGSKFQPEWQFRPLIASLAARGPAADVALLSHANHILINSLALLHRESNKAPIVAYQGQLYPQSTWNMASPSSNKPWTARTPLLMSMAFFLWATRKSVEDAMAFFADARDRQASDHTLFSTIHGWKGRESTHVVLLESGGIRDPNVRYVGETRSRWSLTEASLACYSPRHQSPVMKTFLNALCRDQHGLDTHSNFSSFVELSAKKSVPITFRKNASMAIKPGKLVALNGTDNKARRSRPR